MYRRRNNILVVDDDSLVLSQMIMLLKQRDYVVMGAHSAEQARWWLSQWPMDLLIAAVRMRGMGGLQLLAAARTQQPQLAGILVGTAGDEQIEMDAWRHGATVITRPCHPARILMVVAETLAAIPRRQRWPRKMVAFRVPVNVDGTTGTLVDVSYGGLRLALEGESYDLMSPMTVEVPAAPLTVTAELVWSSRASDGVSCLCGAAILGDTPADWRQFVDRVQERA